MQPNQNDPVDALLAGTKQYLSELDDDAFAALVDEVRPPVDGNVRSFVSKMFTPTDSQQ